MASPFHSDLDTPLLDIGGDPWTIRDACEGLDVFGGPGMGKSSTTAKAAFMAFVKAGMGGTALNAKIDEAEKLIGYIRECGRIDDLVVIDESGKERFNVLDFAAETLGGKGFESNIVEIMRRMNEATKVANPKSADRGGGDAKFFEDGAEKWLTNLFPLLLVAEGTIRLGDVNRFITSLPNTLADVTLGTDANAAWQKGYCSEVIARVYRAAHQPDADTNTIRIFKEHCHFFLEEIPTLDNRPRSSIAATLTNTIYPFLSGKLAELFTTTTTVTPNDCRKGKIVLLNLPPVRYGTAGVTIQTVWKFLFGQASQNNVTPDCRPVFLFADEAQNFLSVTDGDMLAMARSARVAITYISQDHSGYESKLGEADAVRLLDMFGTTVFHANSSRKSNNIAAEKIYKVQKFHVGRTVSIAKNAGTGGHQHDAVSGFQGSIGLANTTGQSETAYLDWEVPPVHFATKLRSGSKRNGYKVDAILLRTARSWKHTGKHWIQVEFDQRA